MKTITEIKKVGKGERYKLFLDDEFFGIYEAEILARYSLKTGESYDEGFFETLMLENGDYACFNRGLLSLEKSSKTKKMLIQYLKEKGYPKSSIDKAVDKLVDYGYVNDESFCENYILSYKSVKSKKKLKYDLLTKGVSEEVIEQKLNELLDDECEKEKCLKFAEKFMKNRVFDLKNKQKFYNHLASKGFDYSLISNIWEEISNGK